MNDVPSALPTPYDIAAIPQFARPLYPEDLIVPVALILAGIIIFVLYRLRKKRGSVDVIRAQLSKDIEQALSLAQCSKSDFAVCWNKIYRTGKLYSTLRELVEVIHPEAEKLLFGPTYSPQAAHELLTTARKKLQEVSCAE